MSDLDPYLISLYMAANTGVELANEYLRRYEITPVLEARITEIATNYGVNDLVDAGEISSLLFDEMVRHAVFETDEPKFAGKYYRYSEAHYKAMRNSYRQNDGITVTAARIGSRFYPDAFDGFRDAAGDMVEPRFIVPASDRIVRLDDNRPEIAEIRSKAAELVEALKTGNDFGDLDTEEVEVARNEALDLQSMLDKSVARSAVIAHYSLRVLRWIAEKAAGAAVGKIAWGLLLMLAAFFGFAG